MFGLSLNHQLFVLDHWISSKPHVSDGQTMWLNVNAVSIWLINFKRINVGHRILNSKRIKRWTPLRWIKCFFIHRIFIHCCTSSKVVFVTCENGKWNSPFCCQVARDRISWFGTFSRCYSVCTAIFFTQFHRLKFNWTSESKVVLLHATFWICNSFQYLIMGPKRANAIPGFGFEKQGKFLPSLLRFVELLEQ